MVKIVNGLGQTLLAGAIDVGDILEGTAMDSEALDGAPDVALVGTVCRRGGVGECEQIERVAHVVGIFNADVEHAFDCLITPMEYRLSDGSAWK